MEYAMEYAIEWQAKKQPPRPEESSNLTYSGQSYASSHGAVSIGTHKVAQGQQPITLVQMQHTAQQEFQHNNDQKLNRNSGENNEGVDNSEYTAVSRSKATAAVEVTDNLRTMLGLDLATV